MTRGRKRAGVVLTILLVANLCFIWGNSLLNKEQSGGLSLDVLSLLPAFIQQLFPDRELLMHLVRKTAHFTEFCSLGALSCGLLVVWRKVSLHPVVHVLSGGFMTAALDETIQIFTHRGSQLQDVWLDFAGFAVGVLVVGGFYRLRKLKG